MLDAIIHTVVVLVGIVALLALWAAVKHWGAVGESRALIGEALLVRHRRHSEEERGA